MKNTHKIECITMSVFFVGHAVVMGTLAYFGLVNGRIWGSIFCCIFTLLLSVASVLFYKYRNH